MKLFVASLLGLAATAGAFAAVTAQPVVVARRDVVLHRSVNSPALVEVVLDIDATGRVTRADIASSTNEQLNLPCLFAIVEWQFQPAVRDGVAVESRILQPIQFVPEDTVADLTPANAAPVVRSARTPDVPADLAADAVVALEIRLDRRGNVVAVKSLESSHEALAAQTVEAARKWKFAPARRNGELVASVVRLPVVFRKS